MRGYFYIFEHSLYRFYGLVSLTVGILFSYYLSVT